LATTGGGGFFDGLEVQDLLNGLQVIANPRDDLALLSALRSPLCGVDENVLIRLRRARSTSYWQALGDAALPSPHAERVRDFRATVEALRMLRDVLPPAELLHRLLERTLSCPPVGW
jgi:ATP-dependent helicase/nuclease subunit A